MLGCSTYIKSFVLLCQIELVMTTTVGSSRIPETTVLVCVERQSDFDGHFLHERYHDKFNCMS